MLMPAIHFAGNCNEVIEFYKKTVNANVKDIAFAKDAPPDFGAELPPDFVMHSEVEIFGITLSLTDGCEKPPSSMNYSLMVMLNTADEVTSAFNSLSEGATITEPLGKQFWADLTGSLTDKYGVNWCILTNTMPQV